MARVLCILFLLSSSAIARAENCACETDANGDCVSVVTCEADTFNRLAHGLVDTEATRDRCLSANQNLAEKLLLAEQRVAALESQRPSPLPWVAGGVVVGLALAALVASAF